MILSTLLDVLRSVADERWAEPWDKVGLQVGDEARDVRRALLCIDLTPGFLGQAIHRRCGLVVAYHPPIFKPMQSVTAAGHWKEGLIFDAIRNGVAIYSPHTALDAAPGGVNDWLASGLGSGVVEVLSPYRGEQEFKIVTFVPGASVDAVREAMATAGAGVIGDYTRCSYMLKGEGTFVGGATTSPKVGRRGRLERVPEVRLEMVCPRKCVRHVVEALRETHPYEEPAFDVYPLEKHSGNLPGVGQGRLVTLDKAVTVDALAQRIRRHLRLTTKQPLAIHRAVTGKSKRITRIGLCAGAGGALLDKSAAMGAEVFFTGEMRHHDTLDAQQRGLSVILAGHTETERPYLPTYRDRLAKLTRGKVRWELAANEHE
ncbi:MAG: Nif3-like dinuclear metal center hexameric protein [Phycisphaera sp.]|nr:Nif3-like dinuclear metal center hexameric protein [Phycisphaera sp.]